MGAYVRKHFAALSEVFNELSAVEVSLPNESQNFAAYTKSACFLIGNHALVGGEDGDTKTAKYSWKLLLVCVYTQTGLGDSLNTGNDLLVLVFAVL